MVSAFTAKDLVTSNETLPATMLVKQLIEWFKANPSIEYATVIDQEGICGLVSREAINARIASNKFGFSVLAEKPITKIMIEDPMIVEAKISVTDLVHHLLQERAESKNFYDDIVVHDEGNFLGLASVKRLIVRQMEVIMEQMHTLQKQQAILDQKNLELVEATSHLSNDNELFQSYFEKCSIPIVVFSTTGQLMRANSRFYKLTGFTDDTLPHEHASDYLFEPNSFHRMLEAHHRARIDSEAYRPTFTLSLICQSGHRQGVEVSFNLNESNNQIIVSILRNVDQEEMAVVEMVQKKVSNQSHLAQKVAGNLIDKEYNLGAAMEKLDALISYADKIESSTASPAASMALLTDTARLSLQNLSGTLGQFSIVDLSQLLVQSRKSGELVVHSSDGTTGTVYFDRGLIIHAISENKQGRHALKNIMMIEHGSFVFHYDTPLPEQNIDGSDPMSILLEACAANDEDSVIPFHATHSISA